MSKQTVEIHWGKHHRAYIDNLNKQIDGTDSERKNLEELVKFSYNNGNPQKNFMGWVLTPSPTIVVNNIIYVFCEKLGHLENK